ncbi:coiled-coil domain-containing protein 148-like [Saccoglossus kowalevskii]|uniref:Coiled-coil domain-containing protein 148-like n=1 Tax=Saccoglossus kowalevskii TaxID=10224 RepID=A0ABM0GS32_SACKO|nr:PREDICTED: coiled-coil domain-containing protein 148-like [Saccoglossus kowalevskii]
MTGRDYRTFLSLHRGGPREIARTSEQDKLMVRMTEGIGSSRYKQLDYEKLKAITFEKKFAANESLMKMERLAKVSKQSKEHHLLNQHKLVWQQEQSRLNHALQRANNELQVFMQDGTLEESSISTLMLEAEELQMQLAMDEKKFRAATIDPILNLKEDLGVWLQEHKAELEEGGREIYSDYERVQDTVESVKNQEEILLDRLSDEELRLQSDLDNTALQDLFTVHEKWVNDGIPEEAEDLECPDPCLKESVLQEFIFLDDRFREKLKEWDHRHQDILRSESGGWTDSDHYWFQVIIDQYPHEMTNRRMLYIDRMKRQLPHKSRAEVVAHEEWYSGHKYYHEHRKVLINSWIKSRKELLNKAHAVFADAFLAIELERIAAINRQRQKEICDQLYEKVKLWREEKMEEMKLQAEIEARRQQELNHEKKIQNEKDKKKRQEEKRKIGVYQSKLNAEREERQERDRKRLQELQIKLAEQAEYDKNR